MQAKSKQIPALILSIDTSCDDTAAAVTYGQTVLSNIIASQTQLHQAYGGVFPTLAKQAHQEKIQPVIKIALQRAQVELSELDAIAVTAGPGLAPALEIGIETAKTLAKKWQKPLIAVNHIEAHALSVLAVKKKRGSQKPNKSKFDLPVLSIVVSGGHSQFILIKDIGEYQILGSTIDDAAGECLDKVGRMLNLGYPAAPVIEELAKQGDENRYKFPLPMTASGDFNLSFSGLKTYARNFIQRLKTEKTNPSKTNKMPTARSMLNKQEICDFAASFQKAVFRHICHKLNKILQKTLIHEIWLGGGVTSNIKLRQMLRQTLTDFKKASAQKGLTKLSTPYSKKLCSDNAAMIGVVAHFKFAQTDFLLDSKQLERKPRWPITTKTTPSPP